MACAIHLDQRSPTCAVGPPNGSAATKPRSCRVGQEELREAAWPRPPDLAVKSQPTLSNTDQEDHSDPSWPDSLGLSWFPISEGKRGCL